jgi:hypothetical protein
MVLEPSAIIALLVYALAGWLLSGWWLLFYNPARARCVPLRVNMRVNKNMIMLVPIDQGFENKLGKLG